MKPLLSIYLLLLSFSAYGALNKWIDADGKVHYSDEPPPGSVKATTIATPRGQIGSVSAQKNFVEPEAGMKKNKKYEEKDPQKIILAQAVALEKRNNCVVAKSKLRALENGTQITTPNDKAKAIRMDDSTRRQNTEEVDRQISFFCGTG